MWSRQSFFGQANYESWELVNYIPYIFSDMFLIFSQNFLNIIHYFVPIKSVSDVELKDSSARPRKWHVDTELELPCGLFWGHLWLG